jgi:hypothetical protein
VTPYALSNRRAKRVAARFYVYVLFRENGVPFYVGKGKTDRWSHHFRAAKAGKKGYRYNVIRDMQSRNVDIPAVKIAEDLSEAEAFIVERALIDAMGRYPLGLLVNQTNGGDGAGGYQQTDEHRAKIGEANRGRRHTAESRAKMSASAVGKKLSPQSIAKTAAANRGRKLTEEHKAAVSKARKARVGVKLSDAHRANLARAQVARRERERQARFTAHYIGPPNWPMV